MAPRIARKPAVILGTRSHGIAMLGNRSPFHKGSRDPRLPLPHEGRDGSEHREKACLGFSRCRSHGIAVIANPAPFHKGSTRQRLPPCRARGGMAPRIARTPVRFLVPAVMALPCLEIGHPFTRAQRSAPPSLPREGRDGSDDREKACGISEPPQSWRRRDWKSDILSQGIDKSASPSLRSDGAGWLQRSPESLLDFRAPTIMALP